MAAEMGEAGNVAVVSSLAGCARFGGLCVLRCEEILDSGMGQAHGYRNVRGFWTN